MSTDAMQTIKQLMWQVNNKNGPWIIKKLVLFFKKFILNNKNPLRFSSSWTSSYLKLNFSHTKMDAMKKILIAKLTIVYTLVYFKLLQDRNSFFIWFTGHRFMLKKNLWYSPFKIYTQPMVEEVTKGNTW